MKRVGYLMDKMLTREAVEQAFIEASRHKRSRHDVRRCFISTNGQWVPKPHLVSHVLNMVGKDTYVPNPPTVFTVYDHSCRKERIIKRPRFYPDLVIQWLVMGVLKPIIMRGMDAHCCGSVPGRGITAGVKYIKRCLRNRKKSKYCLKIDIKKFYDSIDHSILMELLKRKIKDARFLSLLENIIYSGGDKGLPIGYYTSQWLANFYLENLDHSIREEMGISRYCRYVDDMVCIDGNKRKLHKLLNWIRCRLNRLSLDVKGNWQVFLIDSRGIDFIGYRFFHGWNILRKRNWLGLLRCIRRLIQYGIKTGKRLQGFISRAGMLKWCCSFNMYNTYIKRWNTKFYRRLAYAR